MSLFKRTDSFSIIQGNRPIVVAAPHHGTRPNVDSDLVTGPIAEGLAERLEARAVIVNELRRTVDVNKNPLGLGKQVRHHALRYQNEVFRDLPKLVIEVHGHVSGKYPVEISCGFVLDPDSSGDAIFLDRLHNFKQGLSSQLRKIGLLVEIGVYPLDRDVKKPATNTYTFQKIRRARNRAGMEWYGLHIELAANLRTGQRANAPGYFNALTDAFAEAIRLAFDPLPTPTATIPTHIDKDDDNPITGTLLQVIKAAQDAIEKISAVLHPQEISALGFFEGDSLTLYNQGETLRVPIVASLNVAVGKIAIPARARRQLDLYPGDRVTVLRSIQTSGDLVIPNGHEFVIGEVRPDKIARVWIDSPALARLDDGADGTHYCKGPFSSTSPVAIQLLPSEHALDHIASASDTLMKKLVLSIGDTITIEA